MQRKTTAEILGLHVPVPLFSVQPETASPVLARSYSRAPSDAEMTDLVEGFDRFGRGGEESDSGSLLPVSLSRQGSRPDFRKATVRLQLDDQLGHGINLTSVTHAQASFTGALPSSAQISLDGNDGLSVFAQGSINVDSGVSERLELARTWTRGGALHPGITPYAFGALGYGYVYHPSAAGEKANVESWAAGAGLRVLLSPAKSHLVSFATAEVSHGHVNTLSGDPTRVSASLSIKF